MQRLLLTQLFAGSSPASSSRHPEPTGQAVQSWDSQESYQPVLLDRGWAATTLEQLNEVLSFPSWERERAQCRFLVLLFYFAAASPSRCLNVTDCFTAVQGSWRGERRGKREVWQVLAELLSIPDAPLGGQEPEPGRDRWEIHLSGVIHLPRSANTWGSCLQLPSLSPLHTPAWDVMLTQETQAQGCFLEPVSSALLSSRGLPVKWYKVLALLFPLGAAQASSQSSPRLWQPKGSRAAGRMPVPPAGTRLSAAPQSTATHARGLGREKSGGPGWRTAQITGQEDQMHLRKICSQKEGWSAETGCPWKWWELPSPEVFKKRGDVVLKHGDVVLRNWLVGVVGMGWGWSRWSYISFPPLTTPWLLQSKANPTCPGLMPPVQGNDVLHGFWNTMSPNGKSSSRAIQKQ